MALRKIIEQGDECLTKVCRPVTDFNRRLHILLDDLSETLSEANGAGLAAPQVGILRRVCIVIQDENQQETHAGERQEYYELVNPEIVEERGEQEGLEGCLSVPGRWGIVTRPQYVRVHALDRYGNPFEVEGEGLIARALCHEIEHLDGHLYTEHIDHFLSDEELEEYMAQQDQS